MEENKENINGENNSSGKRTAADYEKLLTESQALRAAFLALSSSDPLSEAPSVGEKSTGGTADEEKDAGEKSLAEEKTPGKVKKSARKGRTKKSREAETPDATEPESITESDVKRDAGDSVSENQSASENPASENHEAEQEDTDEKISMEESREEEKSPDDDMTQTQAMVQKPAVEGPANQGGAKRKSLWPVIAKRELKSYFSGPIAYIVTSLFLALSGFMFFSTFFLANRAELRDYFQTLPLLLSLFIPALTMRVFAEENKSGSFETLLTLPVTVSDVVAGKYIASLVSALTMLLPSVFYVIACCIFGNPDAGPIIGGYVGSIFLAAAFTAIGVYCSAKTKNQILALLISLALCLALSMMHVFLMLLPGPFVSLFSFLSATRHFDSISRGILDTRDLIYFVSVTVLFIVLTVRAIKKSMKG